MSRPPRAIPQIIIKKGYACCYARGKQYHLGRAGSEKANARFASLLAQLREDALQPGLKEITAQPPSRSPKKERNAWRAAIARCHDQEHHLYRSYGEKGVRVCDRWRESFDAFFKDMGFAPSPEYSLDRIDNRHGYCCGKCADCSARGVGLNCRWVTWDIQARNKSNVHLLRFNGVSLSISEWSRVTGISLHALLKGYEQGETLEQICRKKRGGKPVVTAMLRNKPEPTVGLLSTP